MRAFLPPIIILTTLIITVNADEIVTRPEDTPDGSSPGWKPREFTDSNVLGLGGDNFTEAREAHPQLLVMFFAPWCSHCAAIAPEWAAAADSLAAAGVSAKLGKVDAIVDEDVASSYGVDSYPTLLWFDGADSEPKPYRGGRRSADIVGWVTRRVSSGSASDPLDDASAASEWVRAAIDQKTVGGGVSVSCLVLLPADADPSVAAAYEAAARGSEAAAFAHTTSPQVYADALKHAATLLGPELKAGGHELPTPPAKASDVTAPAAFLVKPHDERLAIMPPLAEGFRDPEALTASLSELIRQHVLPLIVPFREEYEDELFEGAASKQLIVFGTQGAFAKAEALLRRVARAYQGQAYIVFADVDDDNSDGLVEFFRVTADEEQLQFYGFDVAEEAKYAPPEAIESYDSMEDPTLSGLEAPLKEFLEDLISGNASPLVLSEEAPKHNDGDVTIVVADTFDEIVNQEGVDVLLEVYAPWCGHCKALEPEYEQLGKRLGGKRHKGLVIAKMDGTANDVPGLDYDGYPTLLLVTASNSRLEVGEEVEKTADGLEAFVRANAEVPIGEGSHAKEEL